MTVEGVILSDLRTRIAAALKARDEAATDGIDDPFLVEHASYDELADAVIQELGLQTHLAKRIINGKPDQRVRRHVTDWEIVNE